MITENLSTLKIHKLSQAQYEREVAAGNIDETALYLTPDEEPIELTSLVLSAYTGGTMYTPNNISTVEIGSDYHLIRLDWEASKILQGGSVYVNNTYYCDIDDYISFGYINIAYPTDLTEDTSFTLNVIDENGAVDSKTVWLRFYNGVYCGAAAQPETIDSAFVLGLNKTLCDSKLASFEANAEDSQYIWYCLPTRMGTCLFSVGGICGGFSLVATISFTNASGYTEDYYVYRSDNASLGSTTVSVS